MKSFFKSEAGKARVLALYEAKLASLNIPCEELDVQTSLGRTHVIRTGDPANPPLILVPGSNACAPIGLETYPNLRKYFNVYALDVPAQPNKTEASRPGMKDDSYGRWMHELIDKLGLKDVTLAGFSLGGLIILKALAYSPNNIKEAFLAAPAYLVNGNPLRALLKIFLPMRRYMKTKNKRYVEVFLAGLFTERDPFAIDFLSEVFLHFEMDFTPVPTLSKREAQAIETPLTIVGAGKDIIFPGAKAIKRAKKLIPSLKASYLLEDSKHVQNQEDNAFIESLIIKGLEPETVRFETQVGPSSE